MKLKGWLMATAAALLMIGFAVQPVIALQAAKDGLSLFLNIVLPSLLPFMVSAHLFIESGAASTVGKLLNGIMRPVFACPGESAFALTAGLLAGYPTGARLSYELYDRGLISREDAARTGLLASSCGPVFMIGAVGAGLLMSPAAGWLIALSHFSAVLLTGWMFSIGGNRSRAILKSAVVQEELPPAMEAFGDSIKKTVTTLWMVGGYIVLFSVLSALLKHYNVFTAASAMFAPLLRIIGLEPQLAAPLVIGSIEMTNGCSAAAMSSVSLANRCAVLAVMVSFGGVCIQAQSMLFLSKVGLRFHKFLLAKTVQAAAAFVACRLLALLPVFDSALHQVYTEMLGYSAVDSLMSSSAWAAGGMFVFTFLAFVSGRASTRGSV